MIELEHRFSPEDWVTFSHMGVEGLWKDLYFITNEGTRFQHPRARWELNLITATRAAAAPLYLRPPPIFARMAMTEEDYVFFKLKFL